jgi:hypothetical protein
VEGQSKYCAMTASGIASCGECWECLYFQDAIGGGACPPYCGGENGDATGEGGGGEGEEEEDVDFKGSYAYWLRASILPTVGEESNDAGVDAVFVSAACKTSATVRAEAFEKSTIYTSCGAKSRRWMLEKNAERWCEVSNLTAALPFDGRCVASAENEYCGASSPSVCAATNLYDCCPVKQGVLAGVVVSGALVFLAVGFFAVKFVHRKRYQSASVRVASFHASRRNIKLEDDE